MLKHLKLIKVIDYTTIPPGITLRTAHLDEIFADQMKWRMMSVYILHAIKRTKNWQLWRLIVT